MKILKITRHSNYPKFVRAAGFLFTFIAFFAAANFAAKNVTGESLVASLLLSSDKSVNLTALTELSAPTALAGELDMTFKGGVSVNGRAVSDVLIQPDGKHLIIWDTSNSLGVSINGRGRNGIARLNADGTIDESFDTGRGFDGGIFAMALQPDGKIIVGGGFGNFIGANGSTAKRYIARLNPDGTLDNSFAGFNLGNGGLVRTISLRSDGRIFIGGSFQIINGVAKQGVALLNTDGSLDSSFNSSVGIGANQYVLTSAIQPDGKFVIGGFFNTYGGASRVGIARLNQDGTLDTNFNVGTGTSNSGVTTVALQSDGKILIGGAFTLYNNATAVYVARLNIDGSHDTSFVEGGNCVGNPCTNRNFLGGLAHISVQNNGAIYMSGPGGQVGGTGPVVGYLGRFNQNGVKDDSFSAPDIPCACTNFPAIKHAVQSDGKILTNVFRPLGNGGNGVGTYIRRFNTSGSGDGSYNPIMWDTGAVFDAVRQSDGKVIAVGVFGAANAELRNYIVRFNLDGTVDSTFTASTDNTVRKVLLKPDGKILIAGDFTRVNSTTPNRSRIAQLNADGTLDSFNSRINDSIEALALQPDGKILIGGRFTEYSGVTINRIARLNFDGSIDGGFNFGSGFNERVTAIAVQPNGQIVVGGNFSIYNGTPRGRIVRLNANGIIDSNFNLGTGANAPVEAINILPNGKILIGGDMTAYNNSPQIRIARLNADGSLDAAFGNALQPTGTVNEFYVQSNGKIIIGGLFSSIAGQTRGGIARLNADGTLDTSFGNNMLGADPMTGYAGIFDTALAVDEASGILYYGGRFSTFNNVGRASLARLFIGTTQSARPPFDFDGDGKSDVGIFRPSVGQWWINRSANNVTVAAQFGDSNDKIAPADFTGDGKADLAFFRPSNGFWYILRSEDNSFYGFPFGTSGDVPIAADFDGDGRADQAVFRPSNNGWYIQKSSGGIDSITFGSLNDKPAVADYDGDGKADIAITRINNGNREWWGRRSSNGQIFAVTFGDQSDKPVVGDYTGDGKADIAFWRPSNGFWYILRSEDNSFYGFPFGTTGDQPTPGDFDGDGKFDAAVYRQSNNGWYQQRSTQGFTAITFGTNGDVPVHSAFLP